MTWFILRSSSHLVKTALNAGTLDAAYVKCASFLKPWGKTTHFRGGSRETYRVLRSIKGNCVLHWHLQYAWNMSFSTAHETKFLDAEFNRSKTCFIISFWKWTKLVNRNMKLHNVSHKRSLSQSVSAFSGISFTLMSINVSWSSKIEKLPSNYSSESDYSVSSGGICQNCIVGIGLFRLSRSRPFFSWLCLGYLSPLNVSW